MKHGKLLENTSEQSMFVLSALNALYRCPVLNALCTCSASSCNCGSEGGKQGRGIADVVIQLCNRRYLAALYVVTCAECKQTEEARDIFRNNELLMRRIGQLDK